MSREPGSGIRSSTDPTISNTGGLHTASGEIVALIPVTGSEYVVVLRCTCQ
jgi:hypothetical protein